MLLVSGWSQGFHPTSWRHANVDDGHIISILDKDISASRCYRHNVKSLGERCVLYVTWGRVSPKKDQSKPLANLVPFSDLLGFMIDCTASGATWIQRY